MAKEIQTKKKERKQSEEEQISTLSDTTTEKIQIEMHAYMSLNAKDCLPAYVFLSLSPSLFPTKIIIARLTKHTIHTVTHYHSR